MKKMSDELTNDEIKKNISDMINRFESAKEKTDEYIANKINISRSTVTEWRNKKNAPKDLSTLLKLSKVLECTLNELVYGINIKSGEISIIQKAGLTEKSIKILTNNYIPPNNVLFGEIEYKPSFNRLINYLICKNENIIDSSYQGYVGNLKRNMLNSIFKQAETCINELRNVIYRNKEYQNKTYEQIKKEKLIPKNISDKIEKLPEIVQSYIADEVDKKVNDIICIK